MFWKNFNGVYPRCSAGHKKHVPADAWYSAWTTISIEIFPLKSYQDLQSKFTIIYILPLITDHRSYRFLGWYEIIRVNFVMNYPAAELRGIWNEFSRPRCRASRNSWLKNFQQHCASVIKNICFYFSEIEWITLCGNGISIPLASKASLILRVRSNLTPR